MTDPWYFFELPSPHTDASEEEFYDYNEIIEHLRALAASGAGIIPRNFKTHVTNYVRKWHPGVALPSSEDLT